MPPPQNEDDDDDLSQGRPGPGQKRRSRQMQRRMNVRTRSAEAQEITARAMEKNARYMLWSVIIACVSTVVVAAAAVFGVFARAAH
jgi:hypothetical protein